MFEFLYSLLIIVVIDVVLGGENAIVIALASKNLPPDLRRKAMIWGSVGAVGIRFLCVAAITYLLMIPGLRFVGGLALMYIAYKLVMQEDEDHTDINPATTFWGAMGTIVWADAVMGIDNALGIAGAAQGNWFLIIFGLLFSVPIILFSSTMIAKIMDRWPKTIWLGAFILVIVAIQMMVNEPIIKEAFQKYA